LNCFVPIWNIWCSRRLDIWINVLLQILHL